MSLGASFGRRSAFAGVGAAAVAVTLLAAAACSRSGAAQPTLRRVTLAGDNAGTTQGYAIGPGRVVEDGAHSPDADFYLNMRQIISLTSPDGAAFCAKGNGIEEVTDIPNDAASCTWSFVDLGGNGPHTQSERVGSGWLVNDRRGAVAGKLLIVADVADDSGHAEVTFEFVKL